MKGKETKPEHIVIPLYKLINIHKDLKNHKCHNVLVLAWVEVVFFPVDNRRLCLGFVLGTVLIAERCFSYC